MLDPLATATVKAAAIHVSVQQGFQKLGRDMLRMVYYST